MIWIDLEHKLPTDKDLPDAIRWKEDDWQAWLATSKRLVNEMAALDETGQKHLRNALIENNSKHWAKLKPWLQELSYGKCWFSEVRELFSHYDVEHFRPKKLAKGLNRSERDGYWWLAFDYMNFRVCGNVGNRMKGGWFPLKHGSLCSTFGSRCERSEVRYLIDPIDEHDVTLIAFDEEGKMIPMPGSSEWEQERVNFTSKCLKLNEHTPLIEGRRKVWQEIDTLIDRFEKVRAEARDGNDPVATEAMRSIRTQIRAKLHPKAELSAVARWCILFRNDQRLNRLIS